MRLEPKVKEDLSETLFKARTVLYVNDLDELKKVSNTIIHNASVFQDEFSIDVAVVLYAMSKILAKQPHLREDFYQRIKHAEELLNEEQYKAFHHALHQLLCKIKEVDSKVPMYARHVISEAKVKKGSKLFYHGISIAQSACVLGISQWELYDYIGKVGIEDDGSDAVTNMKKRVSYAKGLIRGSEKSLIFDAGPVITMTMNNLLGTLDPLKKILNADFIITKGVHEELIEKPLKTRRHKLEAFQVLPYIKDKTLHTIKQEYIQTKTDEYLELINNTYFAFGNPIQIVHQGEMEAIALMKMIGSQTLVVDERTTRYLIESPSKVKKRFEHRLHTRVHVDKAKLAKIKKEFAGLRAIRSIELLTVAFEEGCFDDLIKTLDTKTARKDFFEGMLWGLKLAGCGVGEREIYALLKKVK